MHPRTSLAPVLSGRRRLRFSYLVVNGIAQAGIAIATVLLVKNGFDQLVTPEASMSLQGTVSFAVGLVVVIAISAALRWQAHVDAERLGQSYVHTVRLQLFRHVARVGMHGARRMSRGAMVLRFVGDLSALRQWVSNGLSRLTVSGIAVLLAILVLALVENVVAITVGIAVTVSTVIALSIGPRIRNATRASRYQRGRLASQINDRVANIGVVEAFGREAQEKKRFARLSNRLRRSLIERARVIGLLRALSEGSASLASACALFVGAMQVNIGQATPGAVVAAMVVAGLLAPRLQDLGRVYEYWNGALVAREKLTQVLALRSSRRRSNGGPRATLAGGPGRIELLGLSKNGLFMDVTTTVAAGEHLAIVGPNGSGKSTLLRLIAGLLRPDEGAVRLDGQDIASCRWSDLRRAFAMVSPDLALLRGSLRLNLTYGTSSWRQADLDQLLDDLDLGRMVSRLPRGIESRITETGGELSTGERARIALARALLAQPRVLLLDEADANLDQEAARTMDRAVERFPGTVISVTHHRTRAALADRVLSIEQGVLVEYRPGSTIAECTGGNTGVPGTRVVHALEWVNKVKQQHPKGAVNHESLSQGQIPD